MSAALVQRPRLFDDAPRRLGRAGVTRPLDSSDGGGLTLEQRLDSVWEGLRAGGAAECPVCGAAMTLSADRAARCAGCHSILS